MARRDASQILVAVASFFALALTMNDAAASEVEKWLLMPGDVVSSHSEFEAECKQCHAPLSDRQQAELCIECHTEIGSDIERAGGFHGRLPISEKLECANCHTDHEGRNTKIVIIDEATFDHTLADFSLRGVHRTTSCESCHTPGSPHRDASNECVGCHLEDDAHAGSLGEDCGACHSASDWSQTNFDHSRTAFSLTGAHRDTQCASCHLAENFSDVGKTCVSCHQSDDIHKGQNGSECGSCHLTKNWDSVTFDHFAISGFALMGAHGQLTCGACHRADNHHDLNGSTCETCHRDDDAHKGQFGGQCQNCHNVKHWRSTNFDHAAQTDFALPPGHEELECDQCHVESNVSPLPRDCGTCHRETDPHKGQLGSECEACHAPTTWTGKLWFDHDITEFPLLGLHADLDCIACHASAQFKDADSGCISCHAEDDPHNGALGKQCGSCHNPANWRAWLFDHDEDTQFALTGGHSELLCSACHTSTTGQRKSLSQQCSSCHRRDDPHGGRFGDNCDSCHTTTDFSHLGDL